MREITPLHQQPDAIHAPWKRQPLREPVFSHPLAIAGYKAYDGVEAFGKDIRNVIHECHRLAKSDLINRHALPRRRS